MSTVNKKVIPWIQATGIKLQIHCLLLRLSSIVQKQKRQRISFFITKRHGVSYPSLCQLFLRKKGKTLSLIFLPSVRNGKDCMIKYLLNKRQLPRTETMGVVLLTCFGVIEGNMRCGQQCYPAARLIYRNMRNNICLHWKGCVLLM